MRRLIKYTSYLLFSAMFCLSTNLAAYTLQLRIADLIPTSPTVRHIYGNWRPEYSLEAGHELTQNLQAWAEIGLSHKTGYSTGMREKTRLMTLPLSAGLKWVFNPGAQIQPYVGAGLSMALLRIKNNTRFAAPSTYKWQAGALFKSGLNYKISERHFVGLFVDYALQRFDFENSPDATVERNGIDLSGFKFGVAFGFHL